MIDLEPDYTPVSVDTSGWSRRFLQRFCDAVRNLDMWRTCREPIGDDDECGLPEAHEGACMSVTGKEGGT